MTLSVSPFERPWVTEAMIPRAVLLDAVVELDERRDLGSASPGQPGVEHGDGGVAAMLEHEPQLFLEEVGHLPVGRTGGYDA